MRRVAWTIGLLLMLVGYQTQIHASSSAIVQAQPYFVKAFVDDFEGPVLDWQKFEELVADQPACSASGISTISPVAEFARKGNQSLRIWPNTPPAGSSTSSTKRNHTIAYRSLLTQNGVDGLVRYKISALIDPATANQGEVGPEFSIQNHRSTSTGVPGTSRTSTAAIQYVANSATQLGTVDGQPIRWQIFKPVGKYVDPVTSQVDSTTDVSQWVPLPLALTLTPGVYYDFVLVVDYTLNRYVSLSIRGGGTDLLLNLSQHTIGFEQKFGGPQAGQNPFLPSFVIAAEAENKNNNCTNANSSNLTPYNYKVYYDAVELSSGWPNACDDGRVPKEDVLDDFDSTWTSFFKAHPTVIPDPSLSIVSGCRGQAMAFGYDLTNVNPQNGESWIVLTKPLSVRNLTNFTHVRLSIKSLNVNSHETVEVKLWDGNRLFMATLRSLADLPEWRPIYIDFREFKNDTEVINLATISRLEIAVKRCVDCEVYDNPDAAHPNEEHAGTLLLDEFAVVDLKPGSAHRLVESSFESVAVNPGVSAAAADALLKRMTTTGEDAGMIRAWFPQTSLNYNTYAQAEALLVFIYEYERTGNVLYRDKARTLAAKLISLQIPPGKDQSGAWFSGHTIQNQKLTPPTRALPKEQPPLCDGYEKMVPDPNKPAQIVATNIDACEWVGNVGWTLIALGRLKQSGIYNAPGSLSRAIDRGAAWVIGQFGRNAGYPNLISLGMEGNISAYFGLLAAGKAQEASQLGEAIFRSGWDTVQRRMKPGAGPDDVATAIDVSGSWGTTFLRSIGMLAEALDSQGYATSVMRTSSFDGMIFGYGDIAGPYTPAIEFLAQAAAAGIKDADFVIQQVYPLQIEPGKLDAGAFPGAKDHWYGGALEPWNTTMTGVSPTAWVYFALNRDPLLDIARPSIAAISPPDGLPGTTFTATIVGQNLIGASSVGFEGTGVTATILTGGTATSLPLRITIAPGTTGGQRGVTLATATGTSRLFPSFNIGTGQIPAINSIADSVAGISPAIAPLHGSPFILTVNGTNFDASSRVFLGDFSLATTFVSTLRVTAVVRTLALSNAGDNPIKVRNASNVDSNVIQLKVVERGDINGNRAVNIGDALVTALTVGGVVKPALPNNVGDINLSQSTNIGDALVLALFSGRVNANMPTPGIISVSPSLANPGGALTINGTGFTSTVTDYEVAFRIADGGILRITPDAATATGLSVPVPHNAVSGPVQVFRLDQPMGSMIFPLQIVGSAAPLLLASVSPFYQVLVGATVTLTGMGFDPIPSNNTVLFRTATGTVPGMVNAATSSSLTVTVPAGAECGGMSVTVAGKTSNLRVITIAGTVCPLVLTDILGGGGPGDAFVLEGAGFNVVNPSANAVRFPASGGGTVIAPVLQAGATQLHVKIPDNAVSGSISVGIGSLTSNSLSYTGQ